MSYVLQSLVPYTKASVELAFRPNEFFNELERRDAHRNYALSTLKKAYYTAKQQGLIITIDSQPTISPEAQAMLTPYQPSRLTGARIMVIFDIPEHQRNKRQWLRLLLRELKFNKVQQSVWVSDYECREVLQAGIAERNLWQYVQVYEAHELN